MAFITSIKLESLWVCFEISGKFQMIRSFDILFINPDEQKIIYHCHENEEKVTTFYAKKYRKEYPLSEALELKADLDKYEV